ncbi:response regulator [Kineococcus radiotolerans]|uniref:Two component transcriptional regulator, LuxR family n=1 Tax=Kineococcus radiotolerans (strain ATCC BAA-149 / DSM 14245 / SRS30216) TaxID=266940 RepID=A6WB04_KINRD|nr:response regulator transcription factor [Kineococcus radiotolerans]ABS03993.1 two component transcriptional regulator, LuxR family [Kineococcus radiotolerans SRS30216 = ATCC BAA-149]
MTTRVLIADDQEMVRAGFALILAAQPGIDVVAQCADGVEALEAARRLRPDVALLDVRMPRLNGLEVTRRLAGPGVLDPVRVVVVTTFDLDEYVHAALRAGACGFLLKDAGPTLLVEAVRAAAAGESLISPAITVRLLQRFAAAAPAPDSRAGEMLSERELDVVRLVARGGTNAEVGAELFISLGTVKAHLSSVQTKLSARNRVEVAAWAWENGVVGPTGGTDGPA